MPFVDYKALREAINPYRVLELLGWVANHKVGEQWRGPCPVHRGSNPRSFSVNVEKGMWQCFTGCRKGGNMLDLWARCKRLGLYEAACDLADKLVIALPLLPLLTSPEQEEEPVKEHVKGPCVFCARPVTSSQEYYLWVGYPCPEWIHKYCCPEFRAP